MGADFITIESHFEVPENTIKAYTRNKCSEDLVGIINDIALILYPQEEFEICLLPPENGSYKDIIKIIKKKPLETAGALGAVGCLTFAFLTYIDTHQDHVQNEKIRFVDNTAKCLSLKQQISELGDKYQIENIPESKIDEVCGSMNLKRLKNDRYNTLKNDETVSSEETILKSSIASTTATTTAQKKIERDDFEKCIEAIPENEDYLKENVEGVIELISLVVKQKKEGKGIPWRGVYYGKDIKENGIDILLNGEEINFYMQDQEFKKKIDEHEIVFSRGDNMAVEFNIKGVINANLIQNKNIYINKVERFNEDVVEHVIRKKDAAPDNQQKLF